MSVLLPGAIYDPGLLWAGQAGWSACLVDVWHYTVGRDSRGICRDRGLVQTLTRDEGIYQYAPLDAVCWTQCEWNPVATANEVESLDGTVSDQQLALMAYRETFVLATFGIPPDFYDGPRMDIGTPFRGVTNHRNLVHRACDQHYDGFDRAVWDAVAGGAQPDDQEEEDMRGTFVVADGVPGIWFAVVGCKVWAKSKDYIDHVAVLGQSTNGWDNPQTISRDALLRMPTLAGDEPPEMPTAG